VNVGSVFFLFMFIFAIMGMSLFGNVRWGEYLSLHANFESVPNALLTLLRMSTGGSWNGIMHNCMIKTACQKVLRSFVNAAGTTTEATQSSGIWYDNSDARLDGAPSGAVYDRCGPPDYLTIVYFVLFILLCAFLLLNLVIAVILDNFQSSTNNEELDVSQSNLLAYTRVWSQLDPRCTMYIPTAKLSRLLEFVEPPLGVAGMPHVQLEVQNVIMSVDIPNRSFKGKPQVHFLETLHALAGRIAGVQLPADEAEKAQARFAGLLPPNDRDADFPKYSAAHYHAALHVQAAVRGFLARHRMQDHVVDDAPVGPEEADSDEGA
jgi:Ion transport protein/Voltage-dependent L-type calcium channel, IQ-associated